MKKQKPPTAEEVLHAGALFESMAEGNGTYNECLTNLKEIFKTKIPPGRAYSDSEKTAVIIRLLDAWKEAPMLRLGQFISNALYGEPEEQPPALFFIEDTALAEACEAFVKEDK